MKSAKAEVKVRPRRKFPYQVERCPNPEVIVVNARSRFPKEADMDGLNLRYRYTPADRKKRHPLYAALARIKGLESASGGGYALQLMKAKLFTWDELIPKVLKAIQATIAGKRILAEF